MPFMVSPGQLRSRVPLPFLPPPPPLLPSLRPSKVASPGELHQALHCGFPPHHIVFDSPAKTRAELELALSTGGVGCRVAGLPACRVPQVYLCPPVCEDAARQPAY